MIRWLVRDTGLNKIILFHIYIIIALNQWFSNLFLS